MIAHILQTRLVCLIALALIMSSTGAVITATRAGQTDLLGPACQAPLHSSNGPGRIQISAVVPFFWKKLSPEGQEKMASGL